MQSSMLKNLAPVISFPVILFSCNILNAQERFVSVPNSSNLLIDSQDIFIQDHIDPAIRVARVVSINSEGKISNVLATWVNCKANTLGVGLIANGRGEIVYMPTDKIEMTEQSPGTQAYEIIRVICGLPARSGSLTNPKKINSEPRWIPVPSSVATERTGLRIDQDSILNIRGALNFDIVDAKGNSHHAIAICTPSDRRYGQITFTALNGVSLRSNLRHPKPGSFQAKLFKFVCSKYGYLKHGESYRSNR
jgi:hypothetical protein